MRLPRRVGDAAELRKSLKPLLEKRRRARINESLSQLKGLVLPLLGAETSRYSKLEKADILEMTVRFLQEQPASPYPTAATRSLDSYLEGYQACLERLVRVLPACSVLEPAVSARLLEHLRQRTVRGGSPSQTPKPAPAPAPSPQVPPPGSPGLWRPWWRHKATNSERAAFRFQRKDVKGRDLEAVFSRFVRFQSPGTD
ncbi:Transcription factor HES-2 [Microtus ochrogaster]|uniref:Transcription factor HES-2 n=1 Tax=Microtus ochrogaster TaxID=79684 RepID=A0A8J6KPQ4_MICOH|nr:Transcription factor HES-2 [Microtus ochrogaster]